MNLAHQKNNIAIISTTFAFTMLGFLAAVITILFSFSGSRTFKKYRSNGHLGVFFNIYYLAIAGLVITFAVGLLALSANQGVWPMRVALMSVVNNLIHISLLTFIIINMCSKASQE